MLVNLWNVDRRKWIQNPKNVYIGRKKYPLEASKWANPYPISKTENRETVVNRFEFYIRNNGQLLKDIHQLKGKNLGCWCAPKRCHGNILQQLVKEITSDSCVVSPERIYSAIDMPGSKKRSKKKSPERRSSRKKQKSLKGAEHDEYIRNSQGLSPTIITKKKSLSVKTPPKNSNPFDLVEGTPYLTSRDTPAGEKMSSQEVVGDENISTSMVRQKALPSKSTAEMLDRTPHPVSLDTPVRDRSSRGVDLETLISVSDMVEGMVSKVILDEEYSSSDSLQYPTFTTCIIQMMYPCNYCPTFTTCII